MKLYRHKKGAAYVLLYVAAHTETMKDVAVYKALYGDGNVWCRPYDMFMDGRFTPIPPSDLTDTEFDVLTTVRGLSDL